MAAPAMDLEDDDLYGDEAEETVAAPAQPNHAQDKPESKSQSPANDEDVDNDKEVEEEVEEEEDSDIDIITERPDGSKPEPSQPARYTDIHNIPQCSTETSAKDSTPASDHESTPQTQTASSRLPGLGNAAASAVTGTAISLSAALPVPKADAESKANSTSKLDIDGNPVYPPVGKSIMSVVIDTDLAEHEKPWRQPGTDLSDYFNYGFDEFTWALYAAKQESMRNEFSADTLMANQKRMMEEFNTIMMGQMGGGMPGMPGMDPSMMPPEMQQMMQQMMSGGGMPSASMGGAGPMQGIDMQTDPSMFGGNSGNNDVGQSNAGPEGFGGQQFAGTQGNNDFNQGFNNQGMQASRGGFNNRGRGRRHQW